jgi:hypothetical protein
MICLYSATSINSEEVSTSIFSFVSMGVFMDLHSNMSNLFRISTAYLPWLRKILSGLCHTSRPKKQCIRPKSFISNSEAIFFLHSMMSFYSPVNNMSSTYNSNITGSSFITLKWRLESALLLVNPKLVRKLSILPYQALGACFNSYRAFFNLQT